MTYSETSVKVRSMAGEYLDIVSITKQRIVDFSKRHNRVVTCRDLQGASCCDSCHHGYTGCRDMKEILDDQGAIVGIFCCYIAREIPET